MVSSSKYKFGLLWSIGFVVFALVPVLMTSRYQMNLASHILIWGLFAVSFNMLWGVTGMLSFGQALYFGIGAYSIGLFVTHAGKGWYLAAIPIGLVVATGLSFLIGLLVIRVSGVYFTMLTLAFAQLAWQITFKWYNFTGGDDGIQGIIAPGILANKMVYYYVILVVVFLSVWFLKRLAYSPFGLILRCIQQNPNRVRFIGRSVKMNQLRIYVISSFFAALAGTLMAGVDNSIHTDMLYWTTSGEVILMSVRRHQPVLRAVHRGGDPDPARGHYRSQDGVLADFPGHHHHGLRDCLTQGGRRGTAAHQTPSEGHGGTGRQA